MSAQWKKLCSLATAEIDETLAGIPAALRERASQLPTTFERRPSKRFQEDGIEADTLGLFVGPGFEDEELTSLPIPPQIILFLENLWEFAEGDETVFRDEVHTTYLHELGHYLGLNEDDLFDRGLE